MIEVKLAFLSTRAARSVSLGGREPGITYLIINYPATPRPVLLQGTKSLEEYSFTSVMVKKVIYPILVNVNNNKLKVTSHSCTGRFPYCHIVVFVKLKADNRQ